MKSCSVRVLACWLTAFLFGVGPHAAVSADAPTQPRIMKIASRGTNLAVTVTIPEGWQSITLESRRTPDKGAWVPRSVLHGKPLAAKAVFLMPLAYKTHAWRVRGERKSAYPLSFFTGKRAFPVRRTSLWRPEFGIGTVYTLRGDGNPAVRPGLPPSPETRQVRESDIWTRSGDTLYFFNQFRGLQVIDLTHPDTPVLRGELDLPAAGEQLYMIGSSHVALLARETGSYDQSRLLLVDVSGETPRLEASLPMEGSICESRLVGTALYVALQRGVEVALAGTTEWQYGTALISFDLSVPASPVERSSLWVPGGGTAVMATDQFLFLALQSNWNAGPSTIKVIDISSPDGTLAESATVEIAGRVADKFKMNLSGTVFSVFSESYEYPSADPDFPDGKWLTTLETVSLADATNPVPLGSLHLAPGERLHATRFDGTRAYAVTFENTDPLWVLDLSDPANPVVAGDVEVPGWSTYIHPLGDRLVTVGVESGRVAVSLFDVGDPALTVLRSRVYMGADASWSEANWDEKAFSVFPDEGLILVPFEGWSNGVYASQVSLIDLADSALTVRGAIGGNRQVRRTFLHRQRLFALSGKDLLSVDMTDRDQPEVKGLLELSWTVNRVLAAGDYLLQLEEAPAWTASGRATLRVAAKTDPETILTRVDLGLMPVVGTCVRGEALYVLQNPGLSTNLLLTVMDLSALPGISTAAQLDIPAGKTGYGDYEAVWPAPDLQVWISRSSGYGFYPMLANLTRPINTLAEPAVVSPDAGVSFRPWPWWNRGGVHLLALNVAEPAHPEFVSSLRHAPPRAWGFSAPLAAQGCVYLSREQSEQIPVTVQSGEVILKWRVKECLDVIDFADPVHPTVRPAASLPGQLAGLSPDGSLIYTLGSRRAYLPEAAEEDEAICASVYDGVSVYLAGQLPLPKAWPRAVRVDDRGRVILGRAFFTQDRGPVLEAWQFSRTGLFTLEASAACEAPASEIISFGNLLAVQDTTGRITLFDATDPAQLTPRGSSEGACGLWPGLNRTSGSLADGLWIPLDDYGLLHVPIE